MAQFRLTASQMKDHVRLNKAIADAVQGHDLDSGWVELGAARTISLKDLGILPRVLHVFSSDDKNGNGYGTETFSCTATEVTVGGAKKYARVLANR